MITRNFRFLTAAFPHGAYQSQGFNRPELRAPSIKGQLRWWHDALYNDRGSEDLLFGGLKNTGNRGGQGPEASRVIIRVEELSDVPVGRNNFIPHKPTGGIKNAIPPGARYQISLIPRRGGISSVQEERLEHILDAWLLLGAVGQRANRGAGSPWADESPLTVQEYETRAAYLLKGCRMRAAVLQQPYQNEENLRRDAGDFLADEAFGFCDTPFGSARPRKPSPLKLRAVCLDSALYTVALWDWRHQRNSTTLSQGVELLAKSKTIGNLLKEAVPKLGL